ncbi:MAG: ExbD/TolR family protein [bacterium]
MNFETRHKRIALFSTISLTDIVLLLLIFFLLSSSFVIQPGIKVRLPKAASTRAEERGNIYVTITSDERIFLNDERVAEGELGAKLRVLLASEGEKVVLIRADKDLTLEKAIAVVDVAKLAGAEKFLIATQPGL